MCQSTAPLLMSCVIPPSLSGSSSSTSRVRVVRREKEPFISAQVSTENLRALSNTGLAVGGDGGLAHNTPAMSTENPDSDTQVDCEDEKQDSQEKNANLMKAEEAKLKAKYPQKPGGSDFLMKRLQKGQKYFDSGDYNMAKAKMKNKQLPVAGPDKNLVTGDHIPTPQDLPQRKSSLVTSKLAG